MYEDLKNKLQDYAADTMRDDDAEIAFDALNAIEKLEHKVFILEGDREGLLAQIPRWIPVSEWKPEEKVPVQVTYLGCTDKQPRTDMLACIYCGKWCYWDGEPCSYEECRVEITHWMPMPKPPEEEQHDT